MGDSGLVIFARTTILFPTNTTIFFFPTTDDTVDKGRRTWVESKVFSGSLGGLSDVKPVDLGHGDVIFWCEDVVQTWCGDRFRDWSSGFMVRCIQAERQGCRTKVNLALARQPLGGMRLTRRGFSHRSQELDTDFFPNLNNIIVNQ